MESDALIQKCIDICEDHQAVDVVVYDVRGKSTIADYYLICSGNSTTHLRALQQNLQKDLRERGVDPRAIEGTPESRWILADYNDVLIHLFERDARTAYNLEALLDAHAERLYPVEEALEATS